MSITSMYGVLSSASTKPTDSVLCEETTRLLAKTCPFISKTFTSHVVKSENDIFYVIATFEPVLYADPSNPDRMLAHDTPTLIAACHGEYKWDYSDFFISMEEANKFLNANASKLQVFNCLALVQV